MRTTLTIDPDVAAELTRLRKEREISLKALINEALRNGLKQLATAKKLKRRRSFTQPVDLGQPLVENFDCIGAVLADLDAERYR
jgi:ribbon-helix-helix CopG family protein